MPLPWIKAKKVTRISRLVAELQSPSNRSSASLVVETGFPASLLDLYMKNQDRLSKKSFKKKKKKQQQQSESFDTATSTSTSTATASATAGAKSKSNFSSAELYEPVVSKGKQQDEPLICTATVDNFWGPTVSSIENCACPGEDVEGKKVDDGCERPRDGGAVFRAVMKVFVVVVLALGMKELAIGITMSAFVLFFLEYIGRRFGSSIRLILDFCCSIHRVKLKPLIWVKEGIFNQGGRRVSFDSADGDGSIINARSSDHSFEEVDSLAKEIEVVEPLVLSTVCEIVENQDCSMSNLHLSIRKNRWGFHSSGEKVVIIEEIADGVEVAETNDDKGSRKKKLRSKIIKKIFPKQLRHKKGKKSKENESEMRGGEAHCYVRGGISTGGIDEEREEKHGEGGATGCMGLTTLQYLLDLDEASYGDEDEDEDDDNDKLCRYDEPIMAGNANALVRQESKTETKSKETKSNSAYLMLLPIVLIGLLSGRAIAFVLVTVWCLFLMLVGFIKRKKNAVVTLS